MKVLKIAIFGTAVLLAAQQAAALPVQQVQQTQPPREQSHYVAEYIERYKAIAIAHMEKYGIPASIKMAQGMLESDCGRSRLATEGNNHFGIKCKTGWTGLTIHHDDDARGECFRAYSSAEESWNDHSEFLDRGTRYQFLFRLDPLNYKAWAQGLKDAGYATNPAYPELLVRTIEENRLWLLDRGGPLRQDEVPGYEVAQTPASQTPPTLRTEIDPDHYTVAVRGCEGSLDVYINNGVRYVVVREGDDLASVGRRTGLSLKKLRRFNDLVPEARVAAGDVLYLEAKNDRPPLGAALHTVAQGETLHSISQHYAVALSSLAARNGRAVRRGKESGTYFEPLIPGQLIKL